MFPIPANRVITLKSHPVLPRLQGLQGPHIMQSEFKLMETLDIHQHIVREKVGESHGFQFQVSDFFSKCLASSGFQLSTCLAQKMGCQSQIRGDVLEQKRAVKL